MNPVKTFVKTTLIGGVLFLIPLVILTLILTHALRFVRRIIDPLVIFPEHELASVAAAVVALVAASFVAGLVAHTTPGKRCSRWIEEHLLGGLPHYRMVKSMADGLMTIERAEDVQVVLANIEEAWQLAFVFERLPNGWLAVLLPQAPTPMSGTLMYLPPERVRPTGLTMTQAMLLVRRMGVGSAAALATVDLRLPASG
ncbi:MAG: hypothetical protein ACRD3C_18360 [Vicinamibacterales bacterium]